MMLSTNRINKQRCGKNKTLAEAGAWREGSVNIFSIGRKSRLCCASFFPPQRANSSVYANLVAIVKPERNHLSLMTAPQGRWCHEHTWSKRNGCSPHVTSWPSGSSCWILFFVFYPDCSCTFETCVTKLKRAAHHCSYCNNGRRLPEMDGQVIRDHNQWFDVDNQTLRGFSCSNWQWKIATNNMWVMNPKQHQARTLFSLL